MPQPGREAEFREGVAKAIEYAKATQCRTLHVMAGLWPADRPRAEAEAAYIPNLRYAADPGPGYAAHIAAARIEHC